MSIQLSNELSQLWRVPLQTKRKIIIAVNNQDKTYIATKDFAKYVNIASGTQFMRLYTNDQIRNIRMAEQIKYDKKTYYSHSR